MASIIIAAHNEERVLGATLDGLLYGGSRHEIIVVPNGCSDDTSGTARARRGVKVIEVAEGGKANALNHADAVAAEFPRIYLDADIRLPPGGIDRLISALDAPGVLVAVPERGLDVLGRPWPVRAWCLIHERLPVFREGIFGRGTIALTAEARGRFQQFPAMVADDLFLDSLFASAERAHVKSVTVTIAAPRTTHELLDRLVRVRRGSAAMRQAAGRGNVPTTVRRADRWSWLRDVAIKEPRLAGAAVVYVAITLLAAVRARQGPLNDLSWGRRPTSSSPRRG